MASVPPPSHSLADDLLATEWGDMNRAYSEPLRTNADSSSFVAARKELEEREKERKVQWATGALKEHFNKWLDKGSTEEILKEVEELGLREAEEDLAEEEISEDDMAADPLPKRELSVLQEENLRLRKELDELKSVVTQMQLARQAPPSPSLPQSRLPAPFPSPAPLHPRFTSPFDSLPLAGGAKNLRPSYSITERPRQSTPFDSAPSAATPLDFSHLKLSPPKPWTGIFNETEREAWIALASEYLAAVGVDLRAPFREEARTRYLVRSLFATKVKDGLVPSQWYEGVMQRADEFFNLSHLFQEMRQLWADPLSLQCGLDDVRKVRQGNQRAHVYAALLQDKVARCGANIFSQAMLIDQFERGLDSCAAAHL